MNTLSVLALLSLHLGASSGCCPPTTPAPPTTAPVFQGTCSLAAINSRYSQVSYSEVSFMFEQDGSCLVKKPRKSRLERLQWSNTWVRVTYTYLESYMYQASELIL